MAADSAVKELLETSALEIITQEEKDFRELVKGADAFLKKYHNIVRQYKDKKVIFENDSTTPAKKASLLYGEMKKDAKLTQDLTKIQFQLETKLNAFLGRKIYLTWVNEETGDFIIKDEDTLIKKEFLRKIEANRGRGNISKETALSMKGDPITKFSEDIQNQINEGLKKWRSVYHTAVERFNEIKKEQEGQKTAFFYYNEGKNRYAEDNHSQNLLQNGGLGRIAEGYIELIMAPTESDNSVTGLANQLSHLNDHINVENVSAIIKGDVVLGSDSSIQFAVKSGDFSTAMFAQYYKLANNISEMGKNEKYFFTKEELTSYLKPMASRQYAGQELIKKIEKMGREKISEALEEIEKSHSKKKS